MRPFAPLLLACVCALSACSDDFEATGPGRLERPTLTRATPLEAPIRPRRTARLELPEGTAPWTVAGEHDVDSREQRAGQEREERFLRFEESGPWKLAVPGSFDPLQFNQVVVRGRFRSNVSIELTLSADGEPSYTPPALASVNNEREQIVLFDLPYVRQIPFVYDTIELAFAPVEDGESKPFELYSIDLIDLPIELYMPDVETAGGLIDLGVESRHGVGLASGAPASCEFPVQEGDRMTFALGLLPRLRANGRSPRVRVELEADGVSDAETFRLENDDGDRSRWHEERIDLARFAGRTVRATFTYELDKDRRGICALANLEVWRPGKTPKAVFFVTSDTHRGDHLGSAESGIVIETPIIDALARRGILFEDCWSTTNVTSPSHVSMMTGVHPRDHRIIGNLARMSDEADTLAEAFRAAGFATVGVVSVTHLGPRGTGLGQGFDRMIGPLRSPWDAEVAVGHLMDLIGASEGKPIFAWLHVFDAHHPYGPPGSFDRKYYPENKDPFDPSLPKPEIEEGLIPKDLADVRDLEFPRSQYRAEISYLDRELQRLLDMVTMQDALIAVTSDHGEILEKDGTYFNHSAIFPDTLHVPLVLAGPGIESGLRVKASVENIDVGRTLLDLAGCGSADFPGRNLLFAVRAEANERPPRFALAANATSASITEGRWHLMLHLRNHKGLMRRKRLKHEVELYDIEADPECLVDREDDEPDRVRELKGKLIEWLARKEGATLMQRLTHTTAGLKELGALGYATAEETVDLEKPWYVERK
ncbi:MAG: sulfatase [bacterium]|nr:sulfatase [bacterium]